MVENQEKIDGLIRRYRSLAALVAEVETEMKDIQSTIRETCEVGWTYEVDGVPVSMSGPRRKFDLPTAVLTLSPEDRAECRKEVFDEAAVRKLIEERGQLEACMVPGTGEPQVRLR